MPIRLPATKLSGPASRPHAREDVARDQVPRARARGRGESADGVAGGASRRQDATGRMRHPRSCSQARCSGDIGADKVALDQVVVREVDHHAGIAVARDDVAGRGRGAADQVARGPLVDHDAVDVGHSASAGDVRADQVARDDVAARARAGDSTPSTCCPRSRCPRRCPCRRSCCSPPVIEMPPAIAVAARGRARGIRPNKGTRQWCYRSSRS